MAEQKKHGMPSNEEIIASIEGAGYPFEVRVFEYLRRAKVDLVSSLRVRTSEATPETKEIDMLMSFDAIRAYKERKGVALVTINAAIQLRRVHDGGIVGFLSGYQPSAFDLRADRVSPVSGIPSSGVLSDDAFKIEDEYLDGGGKGLMHAFDPLNAGMPYCIQWAVTRRDPKNGQIRTDHESPSWEAISDTVKMCAWRARELTLLSLTQPEGKISGPEQRFEFPTLLVDAPVWTYDATSKELKEVDAFVMTVGVDTALGLVHSLVDVVSWKAIDVWLARYRETTEKMRAFLTSETAEVLGVIGEVQRRAWHTRMNETWAEQRITELTHR